MSAWRCSAAAAFPCSRGRHNQQQVVRLLANSSSPLTDTSTKVSNKNNDDIPSIGFSGAGFLGCYHLGVAESLVKHGILLKPGELPTASSPIMLGASAGSIVSAAVSAGVKPGDDGMNVIYSLRQYVKTKGGLLDFLYPGVSLVDHVWEAMMPVMKAATHDGDEEYFLRRIDNGRLLRIALTDRNKFQANPNGANNLLPHAVEDIAKKNPIKVPTGAKVAMTKFQQILQNAQKGNNRHQVSDAYCYIDSYRNMHDVATACILSSYIPGLTGPAKGVNDEQNQVVKNAMSNVLELTEMNAIKHGRTEKPLSMSDLINNNSGDVDTSISPLELFWDGGLSCIWPTVDDSTVIVCPIRADYAPNPAIHPVLNSVAEEEKQEDLLSEASKSNNGTYTWNLGNEWNVKNLIAQASTPSSSTTIPFHGKQVHVGMDNASTFIRMLMSSDESILEERFHQGYNDANRFLDEQGMLSVYSK